MNEHRILVLPGITTIMQAMLPVMYEIQKRNIPMDIFVFNFGTSDPFHSLYEECAEYLTNRGFTVTRDIPKNQKYDVVYSAYPGCHSEIEILNQVKYFVRFAYGLCGANVPIHNCAQNVVNYYDFIMCLGEPDAAIFSAHAKTINIGNIKLIDYKRARTVPNGKKTILYLPTWDARNYSVSYRVNSISTEMVNKLADIQDKYKIITKMHRLQYHYKDNQEQKILFEKFDNVFDPNTPNDELFNQADVVLSDLSSVAFDAIAADVPLALFGLGEPAYFGGKLCLHQQLVKDGIVPGTNDVNELESIIEKALSLEIFAKQQKLKKEMYPYEGRECIDAFMRFQDDLFNDRVDPWYVATRRALRENYVKEQQQNTNLISDLQQLNTNLQQQNTSLQQQNTSLQQQIDALYNSRSWKITKPMRVVSRFLRRK